MYPRRVPLSTLPPQVKRHETNGLDSPEAHEAMEGEVEREADEAPRGDVLTAPPVQLLSHGVQALVPFSGGDRL